MRATCARAARPVTLSLAWMRARCHSTVRTLRSDLLGDLAVGVAEREQREHLALAAAELVGRGHAARR